MFISNTKKVLYGISLKYVVNYSKFQGTWQTMEFVFIKVPAITPGCGAVGSVRALGA